MLSLRASPDFDWLMFFRLPQRQNGGKRWAERVTRIWLYMHRSRTVTLFLNVYTKARLSLPFCSYRVLFSTVGAVFWRFAGVYFNHHYHVFTLYQGSGWMTCWTQCLYQALKPLSPDAGNRNLSATDLQRTHVLKRLGFHYNVSTSISILARRAQTIVSTCACTVR